MADLSDVYGNNYSQEATQSRLGYNLNIIANNISHRQFKFKVNDTKELWNGTHDLTPNAIQTLLQKVKAGNGKMTMIHLNKRTHQINMLPELIIDTPVEYFLIIDAELNRAYFIYITPSEVHAY